MSKDDEGPKVPKKLSKTEIEERGKDLAETVGKLEKLKVKHKDQKTSMKDKESELESKIHKLAVEVETGEEFIDAQEDLFA